jgi:hypothetical protein
MTTIYDPIKFIEKVEVFTIAVVGSFITIKLLNAMYDNLYEPIIDLFIDSEKPDQYYIKIGKYYVQIGMIFKEIIKWIILIFFLMVLYNLLMVHG